MLAIPMVPPPPPPQADSSQQKRANDGAGQPNVSIEAPKVARHGRFLSLTKANVQDPSPQSQS